MLQKILLLGASLLVLTFPGLLQAQVSTASPSASATVNSTRFEGTHEIRKENGDELRPGWKATLEVTPLPGPYYIGKVFLDKGDGNGPQEVADEEMVICGVGGYYTWENVRGSTGTITKQGPGNHTSEVTGGPNSGTKRQLIS